MCLWEKVVTPPQALLFNIMDSSIFIYNYITTNTLNGMQYVGMHSTSEVDDGYLGSGKIILNAIKKYGKENFTREIITFCSDVSTAFYNEGIYIEKYNTLKPNGYNLSPKGGNNIKDGWSEESRKKMSISKKGKKHSEETNKKRKQTIANKPIVTCPHCDKEGKGGAMKQYHFDNCILHKSRSTIICPHCHTVGKVTQMKQWHFDNCPELTGIKNTYKEVTCPHCGKEGKKSIMMLWHFDNCISIKPRPTLICPHCGKEGKGTVMKQWHFDNCKEKR